MEILAYFYGPIGVLLAVNLIFFAATARELTCGLWKGEFVKSTTERRVLFIYCKDFFPLEMNQFFVIFIIFFFSLTGDEFWVRNWKETEKCNDIEDGYWTGNFKSCVLKDVLKSGKLSQEACYLKVLRSALEWKLFSFWSIHYPVNKNWKYPCASVRRRVF